MSTDRMCKARGGRLRTLQLAQWVTVPTMHTMGTPDYLHAAVRHGHGVIGQCIAGYLAVVGTGGWRKDVARTYVVWINRLAPLEGPAVEAQQRGVTDARQTPR